jgi:uncharacterized membrane protein YphA (DoxX/SURF4 family)
VDEVVGTAIRVGAGALLLSTGLLKLRHGLDRFTAAVLRYELLPRIAARAAGRAIPLAEIVLGLLLLGDVLTRPAAFAAAALVSVFTVAVAVNLSRGRRDSCGCGSVLETRIGPRVLARNTLLVGALALLAIGFGI